MVSKLFLFPVFLGHPAPGSPAPLKDPFQNQLGSNLFFSIKGLIQLATIIHKLYVFVLCSKFKKSETNAKRKYIRTKTLVFLPTEKCPL